MRDVVVLAVVVLGVACGPAGRPVVEPGPEPAPAVEDTAAQVAEPTVLEELGGLAVAEAREEGYDRDDWKHWEDADDDCQHTRQEVLIAESEVPVTFKDARRCRVATGQWRCPYTGEVFTNPRKLDVDHMVPLAEAHRSGGYGWSARERERYANDLEDPNHLVAVKAGANRSKGARPPSEWMPQLESGHCAYLAHWVAVKRRWHLSVTLDEQRFVAKRLRACPGAVAATVH